MKGVSESRFPVKRISIPSQYAAGTCFCQPRSQPIRAMLWDKALWDNARYGITRVMR